MTRLPGHGRLEVADSLFDRLRVAAPDLTVMSVTKSTLVATSHLIETLVYDHRERCVLVSGFQHGRNWAAERDRYLALAGEHDVIAVFAGRQPPAGLELDQIGLRLRTGDPLAQEWFVLAVGPGLAITLCGLDGDAHTAGPAPTREADRLFEVVWSVDPAVAAVAAQVVVEAVERAAPDQAGAVADQLARAGRRPPTPAEAARATDTLLAGMVQRLEATRMRERQALSAAGEQKNKLLSRISHELRTPLNAILGFAQLLDLDLAAADADARESVGQILTAGRHLVELVDEILAIGRIEAGELHLTLAPVPVGPLVAGVLAMTAPLAAERSLTVTDTTGVGDVAVVADEMRLRQVLINLVSNAIKYNSDGGRLGLSVSRTPDAVRLAVSDTGRGLSAEQVDRLFTPFERFDAGARGITGTGLGLVVTRELVEAMGGYLEVDSRVGTGTTVVVALPAAPS